LTATELAVVVLIVGMLGLLLALGLRAARADAVCASCKRNLKMIGLALNLYAGEYGGFFPRGPEGSYSSYALGLLVYGPNSYLPDVGALVCPASDEYPGRWQADRSGHHGGQGGLQACSTSYSYDHFKTANSSPDAAVAADEMGLEAPDTYGQPGRMASPDYELFSDIATASESDLEARKALNSPNHAGEGQNVLYVDGHVSWSSSPFAGRRIYLSAPDRGEPLMVRDEIYSLGSSGWPPTDADSCISDHSLMSLSGPANILQFEGGP